MKVLCFAFAFVFVASTVVNAVQLQIVGANQPGGVEAWESGPFLSGDVTLCRADLPAQFTILCIPNEEEAAIVNRAVFFVNDVRTMVERRLPYSLAGDDTDLATPFEPTGDFTIRCRLPEARKNARATVTFSCDEGMTPTPTPAVPTPEAMSTPSAITPAPTPTPIPMTPTPDALPTPTSVPMTPTPTTESVPTPDSTPATPTPEPIETPTPTPTPRPLRFVSPSCVRIGAQSYDTLVGEWVPVFDGLIYRPDKDEISVDQRGVAPATYTFVAPSTSVFGISLDMTTGGRVDHNDFWLQLPGVGFHLIRMTNPETMNTNLNANIKAFHNNNGRAIRALTVDFNGHVISSGMPLVENETYTIRVGGRSSKTTLHNIILFACNGIEECGNTTVRRQRQRRCQADRLL